MADYKELLRRAVEALPENNGAARRAVYEKARAALVGQLRAIHPPLPARDITTHRLQLEDCIRQVEQEASEAVIAGMSASAGELPPPPVYFEPTNGPRMQSAQARPQPPMAKQPPAIAKPESKPKLVGGKDAPRPIPQGGTIEEIIAAANAESPIDAPAPKKPRPAPRPEPRGVKPSPIRLAPPPPQPEPEPEADLDEGDADVLPPKPAPKPARPLPAIVARAEAAKSRSASTAFSVPAGDKPYDNPRRGPTIEPRPSLMPAARGGQAAVARQPVVEPVAFLEEPRVVAAMSSVREVEVEPPHPVDPQGAIDRAIATLDREARGDSVPPVNSVAANDSDDEPDDRARGIGAMMSGRRNNARSPLALPPPVPPRDNRAAAGPSRRGATERVSAEAAFPRARRERSGGLGAVAIFLIVFLVLLGGAGGAGYWAVSAGYLDLSGMLGNGTVATAEAETALAPVQANVAEVTEPATGPGTTAAPVEATEPPAELATAEERLTPEIATAEAAPLALTAEEDRLTADASPVSAEGQAATVAALDPANIAGSQSLLLEASDNGTTGAVPFSGTIEWSKGTDEMGQPTLVGKANIPARNLGVDVLIRKNSDTSLPASHLMEINFRVSETFIGGSIAGLPGVLLKNEELVQGTPLVGASARVVGNSFLFALSASQEDLTNNTTLLTQRKWIDLALIYATGKKAIITLEKDANAEQLFTEVFGAWGQTASN